MRFPFPLLNTHQPPVIVLDFLQTYNYVRLCGIVRAVTLVDPSMAGFLARRYFRLPLWNVYRQPVSAHLAEHRIHEIVEQLSELSNHDPLSEADKLTLA
jgi:hypothetical protein